MFLVLFALRDTIVFFHTPKEVVERQIPAGQRIRLGGLVAEASVKRGIGQTVEFAITDTIKTIQVRYKGILPDLFREGQGVVTEGVLDTSAAFLADTVLAKHDENYMPPEVAKSLKEQGLWQRDGEGEAGGHEMTRRSYRVSSSGLSRSEIPGTQGDHTPPRIVDRWIAGHSPLTRNVAG